MEDVYYRRQNHFDEAPALWTSAIGLFSPIVDKIATKETKASPREQKEMEMEHKIKFCID